MKGSSNHKVPKRARSDIPYYICIELDLSSLTSFAFFAAYHIANRRSVLKRDDVVTWLVKETPNPKIYRAPLTDDISDSCTNQVLICDTTLGSLAWACIGTSFYGKRRGRLFCEQMEATLLTEILSVIENVKQNVYSFDDMPIPPTAYTLQEALRQREFVSSRSTNANGKPRMGFCVADVLTFCYLSLVFVVAAKPENSKLRLRLLVAIPNVLEWWKRIQLILTTRLLQDDSLSNNSGIDPRSFKCCHDKVNPLDTVATSLWLESEEIIDEFKKQLRISHQLIGLQSRPAGKGRKKGKSSKSKTNEMKIISTIVQKIKDSRTFVKCVNVDDSVQKSDSKFDNKMLDPVPWESLPKRLNPEHYVIGKLTTVSKREKKRQQISNMIEHVNKLLPKPSSIKGKKIIAVDFCCGSGHVGLVLAAMRPEIHVYFLDCNAVALAHAETRAAEMQVKNVKFLKMDIREYPVAKLPFHVGFALHGCGPASDFVLEKCLSANASYVLCPCCIGFIQNEKEKERVLPCSKIFREVCGVTREEFIQLSQKADHTSLLGSVGEEGQYAMRLVNEDRNWFAKEYQGGGKYHTFHYDMHPKTCSPKNQMIIGKRL